MNEEQELAERLAKERPPARIDRGESPSPNQSRTDIDFAQWQICPNGKFRPGAKTRRSVLPGIYRCGVDDLGPYIELLSLASDDLIELPEPAHVRVLTGIRKFWDSRARYAGHGLLYKRGILLWGPPGGGKTVTVQLLMKEIIGKHSGIVLLSDNPNITVMTLRYFRKIEPKTPLIVVFEDVDETINQYGEHALLAVLDGEHQTDNVVYLATTNYPERLGARIVNRPSRFDERIKIGMPSAEARRVYLAKAIGAAEINLHKWCMDTEGLSIAHLRELVVACLCLEQDYDTVIARLRAMEIMPKPEGGFRQKIIGLANQTQPAGSSVGAWR